jgi:hypothetical protein
MHAPGQDMTCTFWSLSHYTSYGGSQETAAVLSKPDIKLLLKP